MQVEQAMNEVIEFFSSVLFLSLLKTVPVASKKVSDPTRCYGKNTAQSSVACAAPLGV